MFHVRVRNGPKNTEVIPSLGSVLPPPPPLLPPLGIAQEDCKQDAPGDDANDAVATLAVVTGNPRIEVITGELHLYRPNHAQHQQQYTLPLERGTLLCMVAVPTYMSPLELLEFVTDLRHTLYRIRVFRDPNLNRYMALIQFQAQQDADNFFEV